MTTLESALAAREAADVLADVSTEIGDRGGDDKSFPETSTAYQLLRSYSEARAAEEAIRVDLVRAGSLSLIEDISEDNGRDDWIDLASRGQFAIERDPATAALHRFRLTNAPAGIARTFKPGDLRARFGAIDFINVTYDDITDYAGSGTLTAGTSTLDLLFEAQTKGSAGNVPAGYVTQLVTVFAGVTVSNPAITGTGSSIYRAARDAERNASVLDRDTSRWGASSAGGSNGSIVEWLHEAFVMAGVTNTVTKWYVDDTNPDGPGTTRLYIGNDNGPGTAAEIAIVQPYQTARRTAGTGGGGILVLAAIARAVSFTATIKNSTNAAAGTDSIAVVTAINAAATLGAFTLYKAELVKLLMLVSGTTDVPLDLLTFEDTTLEPGELLTLSGTFTVIP